MKKAQKIICDRKLLNIDWVIKKNLLYIDIEWSLPIHYEF